MARAAGAMTVVFDDPQAAYAPYYDAIRRNVVAAGDEWIAAFGPLRGSASLVVEVGFSIDIPIATGGSTTSSFVRSVGALNVFEQGAATKLRTGVDLNGLAPDIAIEIGAGGYLQNELWFDPEPAVQREVVPGDRVDARSLFLHELGHAFGFNGWRDAFTGQLPGNYESTFDAFTIRCGPAAASFCFAGPRAEDLYGSPVPLTDGHAFHLGNAAPGAGSDLVDDLMNGVAFEPGRRYAISPLDLAVMADVGLPVSAVPEPATYALLMVGLVVLWLTTAARRRSPE
jgi:hypothetical protein